MPGVNERTRAGSATLSPERWNLIAQLSRDEADTNAVALGSYYDPGPAAA